MQARTEAEILAKAPIKVKLGEKQFEIPVLTILPSREWRIKLSTQLDDIINNFKVVEYATGSDLGRGLTGALIRFPEKVADLVFAYAGDSLNPEAILATSTEEQLATAFSAIMQVAFPYLPSLAMATHVLRSIPKPSQPVTAKSTN